MPEVSHLDSLRRERDPEKAERALSAVQKVLSRQASTVADEECDEVVAKPSWARPHRVSERYVTPRLLPAYRFIRRARAPLKPIVKSKWFEYVTILIIMYCSIVMGIDAEISRPGEPRHWFFIISDTVTSVLFLVEWGMRVTVGGVFFFREWTNVVLTGAAWLPILLLVGFGESLRSVQVFARWMRISKVIHTVKHVPQLKVIWLLVTGLFSSASTLFWSCVLIAITVSFFALIAVDLIGKNPVWQEIDQTDDVAMKITQFRTLGSAMRILMRFANNDDAMDILEKLMEKQPFIWIFIVTFMAISQYVLLNLVTAVICNHALKAAMEDEERKAAEAEEERERQIEDLKALFKALDVDGSNEVSAEEFDDAFDIPGFQHKLFLLGIEEAELKRLFRALDTDGSASMNVEEFCQGLSELSGQATAFGMLRAKKTAERTEKRIKRFGDSLAGVPPMQKLYSHTQMTRKFLKPPPHVVEESKSLEKEILSLEAEVDERLGRLDTSVSRLAEQAARMAASLKFT